MNIVLFSRKSSALKVLVLTFTLLAARPALAWHIYCDGPVTYSELLSSTTVFTSPVCKQVEPLLLVHEPHRFSFGTYSVDFWQGAYARAAEQTDVIRDETYNCFGRLLSRQTRTEKTAVKIKFEIDNPNLHDDVTSSIIAEAPMLDSEARQALVATKATCEAAK